MRRPAVLLILAAFACRPKSTDSRLGAGQLEARWTDSASSVQLIAPARAFWCAADTVLMISAVRNDSAVGLALYPKDSLRVATHPVSPSKVFFPWRPQASAALRVLGLADIKGYESTWGQVAVTEAGAQRVSGTFDLHVQRTAGGDSLHLVGGFSTVAVEPAPRPCGRANKPRTG